MGNKQNKGASKKTNKKNEDPKRSKSAEPFNESSSHNNIGVDNKPSIHSHKSSINNLNRSAVTPPPRPRDYSDSKK